MEPQPTTNYILGTEYAYKEAVAVYERIVGEVFDDDRIPTTEEIAKGFATFGTKGFDIKLPVEYSAEFKKGARDYVESLKITVKLIKMERARKIIKVEFE